MNRMRLSSFLPHVLLHRLAFLLSIIWHCDDELFLGLERVLTGFDDILQMRVCCILTVVTFLLVSRSGVFSTEYCVFDHDAFVVRGIVTAFVVSSKHRDDPAFLENRLYLTGYHMPNT